MFYVYQYLRDDGTPYYIGKGKGQRAWCKSRSVNLPTNKANIKLVAIHLSEPEAFLLEKILIATYGRKDNGTGILRNLTDGGEGSSGFKRTPEMNKKVSESRKGVKPWNAGQKGVQIAWNAGRTGQQVGWNKGRTGVYSEETIERMRIAAAKREKDKREKHGRL